MKRNAIALTGGIGSGKSAVGNYLRQKGFVVVDCDQLSREVATHPQVQQKVAQLLGEGFVSNGQLDRAKIRNVIFQDEQLHKQYSQIFFERIKDVLCEHINQTQSIVFVEIPLVDAFDFPWQQIWLVERDVESRITSVMGRDSVSRQNVLDILSKQKVADKFTVKISNNSTLDDLYNQIDNLLIANNLA